MKSLIDNLILTVVLGGLTVAALFGFNRAAAPQSRVLPIEGVSTPRYAAVLAELTPERIAADLEALTAAPSRFSGSPGAEAAARYLERELAEAGYEVIAQPFEVTVPKTYRAELLQVDGTPFPGVTVSPLLPNWFRTSSTPPAGITGTVYRAELGLAREFEGVDLDGQFVLLPLGTPWAALAGMGARAVFFYDTGTLSGGANWNHHVNASLDVSRVLVEGDVAALDGQTVVLNVDQRFESVPVRNILALHEVPDADELLIVSAIYDAYSYVPDRAPGAGQACGAAALLAAARHLADERDGMRRSVVFVATAGDAHTLAGIRAFAETIGQRGMTARLLDRLETERDRLNRRLELADAVRVVAQDPDYWQIDDRAGESAYWSRQERGVRDQFQSFFALAMNDAMMESIEHELQARVRWNALGMPVTNPDGSEAASFTAYTAANAELQQFQALLATEVGEAKTRWAERFIRDRVPERVAAVADARTGHIRRQLDETALRLALARRFSAYDRVLNLHLDLSARSERLALSAGAASMSSQTRPADSEIESQLQATAEALDRTATTNRYLMSSPQVRRIRNLVRHNDEVGLPFVSAATGSHAYFHSPAFIAAGHPGFVLSSLDDSRQWFGSPQDTPLHAFGDPGSDDHRERMDDLATSVRIGAGTVARLALGHGRLIPVSRSGHITSLRGQVVSRIGENLTPDHPMPGAIVRVGPIGAGRQAPLPFVPGISRGMVVQADMDGFFHLRHIWQELLLPSNYSPLNIDAALIRQADGDITWTLAEKDSGPGAPYATQGVGMAHFERSLAMPVLFRATGVQVVPMQDPATLSDYHAFGFIEQRSLAAPTDQKIERAGNTYVCFVPPESRLFFTFRKGSFTNPNLTAVRAFALNATGPADGSHIDSRSDLVGDGYFAADNRRITNIEIDTAVSMAQVNSRRLAVQERHDMADEMMISYNARSVALAEQARGLAAAGDMIGAKRVAGESVAYASNVHPVIRKNASDAVAGIVFYLLLAIPFAVFAEKLLIGHPDIRYQITGQAVIFLLFFFALRLLHPAYELVRSSYMILLGFVTFVLAMFVGSFVTARFSDNIGELQKRLQKRAEVADVSRAGAASSAFILGLGHMRKRMVRTGLTVGTLILTMFVMLSFTSMTTDVVDSEFAVGVAPYTGLFVRNRAFTDVSTAWSALQELYGRDHLVAARDWAGNFTYEHGKALERAAYRFRRDVGDRRLEVEVEAILGLSADEIHITGVKDAFEVLQGWFDQDDAFVCYLPREMADALRIDDGDVLAGEVMIQYGDREYRVAGIFDSLKMEGVLDLDGESILPLDVLGLMRPGGTQSSDTDPTSAPEDTPRLPGGSVVITPRRAMPARTLTASVAVALQDLEYAQAREVITSHLERSGVPSYYGIDGIAFFGGKLRQRSVEGLLDLLLPIIIAALTVLNTMRGSVYERKDEIYVFNSVGLSPTHIRALFLAEASVYAVVGTVGGYLVAQGVGTGAQWLGIAGGLSMNYSSMASIIVSLVIMAVVFISSIFPARMAAKLAAPADSMTRERHTAAGDVLEIDLPFMFSARDRVAVIPYFIDWFENYGEGSSGEFTCSRPECAVVVGREGDGAMPLVSTVTWLKPYDLGVSQRVDVAVRYIAETNDNVATVTMTRLSGDTESWERCCYAFIGLLRKRFLTWRGISGEQREALFGRGCELLEASVKQR